MVRACAGAVATTMAKPDAATAHNNLALMVILGLPWGWLIWSPHPNVVKTCDNGQAGLRKNIAARKRPACFIHPRFTIMAQPCPPIPTRGTSHDDIFPRGRRSRRVAPAFRHSRFRPVHRGARRQVGYGGARGNGQEARQGPQP